jgi:hypothetical protein
VQVKHRGETFGFSSGYENIIIALFDFLDEVLELSF